jgi:hypothetical protein
MTAVTDAALNVTHYAYDLENNLLSGGPAAFFPDDYLTLPSARK